MIGMEKGYCGEARGRKGNQEGTWGQQWGSYSSVEERTLHPSGPSHEESLSCAHSNGFIGKELLWLQGFYDSLPIGLCFNLCMLWRVHKRLNYTDLLSWYLSLAVSSWGYPRSIFLKLWFIAVVIEENCSTVLILFISIATVAKHIALQ